MAASRERVVQLLKAIRTASCRCPAHSHAGGNPRFLTSAQSGQQKNEYAFEMSCSTVRFGPGVTSEVGMDLSNMGAKHVCVMTDPNISALPALNKVLDSLKTNGVQYTVYDQVRVEPSDKSVQAATQFLVQGRKYDALVALGGGSVMDTCKAANLYSAHPEAEFADFLNPPVGRGLPATKPLLPTIAIPTTSGTGSETTGMAILDLEELGAKTGIASKAIRPTLALVDPELVETLPCNVAAYSGFDVLCHALESYTALPYYERPRPNNPLQRPTYQGSNPISDIWAKHALAIMGRYFVQAVHDPDGNPEARTQMHLASTLAGIGFGNAGVHLCHGMSYPVASKVRSFVPDGYKVGHPIIPHGLSVVMTSPAVFRFTSRSCPERHLEAADILNNGGKSPPSPTPTMGSGRPVRREDAGFLLADTLLGFMSKMDVPDGLKGLGFYETDIPDLVKGTLPQERVTRLSPRTAMQDDLFELFEDSMTVY